MPICFAPALLALAVGRRQAALPMLHAARHFSVNVLGQGQLQIAEHFRVSGRTHAKLAGIPWRADACGAPLRPDALACLSCEIEHCAPAGDHELFVARVSGGILQRAQALPLRYADTGNMDGSDELYGQRRVPTAGSPYESNQHR